jgi:hypothetical protein
VNYTHHKLLLQPVLYFNVARSEVYIPLFVSSEPGKAFSGRETHILERVAERISASSQHVFSADDLLQFLDNLRARGHSSEVPSSHELEQLVIATGIVSVMRPTTNPPP